MDMDHLVNVNSYWLTDLERWKRYRIFLAATNESLQMSAGVETTRFPINDMETKESE